MQLSILPDPSSLVGDRSSHGRLDQVKTGDHIKARIVKISPTGRTVLQFAGFRAVSDRPVGERVGEIVHFEVLPDAESSRGKPAIDRSCVGRTHSLPNPRQGQTATRFTSPLRLNAVTDTPSPATSAKEAPSPQAQDGGQLANANLSSGSAETATLKSFQIISKWFHRLRKDRPVDGKMKAHPSSARDEQGGSLERSALKGTKSHERAEPERADRAGESTSAIDITSLHMGHRPVRLKIYDDHSGRREDIQQLSVKAVFLLDLDATGPVRTDINMRADHIDVRFFVASQKFRGHLARALPDLRAALSAISPRCSCQVAVSRQKISAFMREEDERADHSGLTIKA